jgi:hypothetical protein
LRQAAAQEAQTVASQLREELQQQELSLKRKLGNEAAARRAAEEELRTVRQELSQLQGMLGPGTFGAAAAAAAGGLAGLGGLGLQQQQHAPGQQLGDSWRAAAGGPPALAAPGFKWVLVREGEDPAAAAAAAAAEDELGSSLPGTPHSVLSGGVGFGNSSRHQQLQRAASAASSGGVAVGGFDTAELLQQHGAASASAGMSDAASAYGGVSANANAAVPVSPTSTASVQQLHQQQLRQVAARLGSGSVGEATLQRLRAALRQKTGECAALEARLRELEATRDQLAGELVAATHVAEKVGAFSTVWLLLGWMIELVDGIGHAATCFPTLREVGWLQCIGSLATDMLFCRCQLSVVCTYLLKRESALLVCALQRVLQASDAVRDLPKMQQAYQELQARYAAAVELVGERDEQLEELANDLEDVKQMYRQQIETLLAQQQ